MIGRFFRSRIVWAVVALGVLAAAVLLTNDNEEEVKPTPLSQYQTQIRDGQVKTAEIDDRYNTVTGQLRDGKEYRSEFPDLYSGELTEQLISAGVDTSAKRSTTSTLAQLLTGLLPILLLLAVFLVFLRYAGGGKGIMQFGKSKARMMDKDQPQLSFKDVAGADEAVVELEEIKEFLESPAKFHAIGAKIPRGVLLVGPPGTGKTLLAKAVAGEAGVPFFTISGSDFVEMFVGVGASRVRDLFEQAKAAAPCIIFMDEIDAVGRSRGSGMAGGNDEREQTLNQLLVEMDGFDARTGIIIIAATNRPDVLDPALLRPGRFDRQITVDRPDIEGRKAVLAVHSKEVPMDDDINFDVIARRTPGFTGADLANTINEAALIAARRDAKKITMDDLEAAIDRVIGGPERKNRVMSDTEKRTIAVHEGGHAIVGRLLQDANPVHKVSVIARGRALGWTLSLPTEDRNIVTRKSMKAELAVLLGGRAAEEVFFKEPSTGAANDIEKVSSMAHAMVKQYGMSDALGPQQLGSTETDSFLGRQSAQANYSGEMAARIDAEVRLLVDDAHATAVDIVTTHKETLGALADALCERETLGSEDLEEIWGHLPYWDPATSEAAPATTTKAKRRAPKPKAIESAVIVDEAPALPIDAEGNKTS